MVEIEEMKEEAVKRMEILKLHPKAIKEFINENKLNRSEGQLGALFWLTDEEKKLVKIFEDRKGKKVLVYHIIHTYSNLGETYDILFVGEEKDEWQDEREDLMRGFAFSRTEVMEYKFNSEYGTIAVEKRNGRCSSSWLKK